MRALPEDEFLSEMAKRYGALPAEVIADAEMRALVVPILRADISVIENYSFLPEAPLNCDISVFGGSADQMVKRQDLEPWQELTSGRFRLQMLDGNHLFLKSHQDHLLHFIAGEMQQFRERELEAHGWKETRI